MLAGLSLTDKRIPKYAFTITLWCAACGAYLGNAKQTDEIINELNQQTYE